jgi:hypothetical protein
MKLLVEILFNLAFPFLVWLGLAFAWAFVFGMIDWVCGTKRVRAEGIDK